MSIKRRIQEVFRRRLNKKLQAMIRLRRHREVIDLYVAGRLSADAAPGVVGYCYYQLGDFEKAIPHLEQDLKVSPNNYYSSVFLALSFKNLNKKREAVAQFLECLKSHQNRATEILDQLLPLASSLIDSNERRFTFDKISNMVTDLGPASLHLAKVLFHQRRDKEMTSEMLQGASICRFYSGKEITDAGHGQYVSFGPPEKLRFLKFEDGSEVWVDTMPPYVAEISDARITSGSTLIHLDGNKILSDVLSDKNYGRFANMEYDFTVAARRDDALLVKPLSQETEIPEGVMLCGLASNAYGHWFAEFLPKLRFFEKHPRFAQMPIIIDEGMPQSHYDFLAALVSNPTYILKKGATLRVKSLLVAPADTFFPLELMKGHEVPHEHQSSLTVGALRYIDEKIKNRFREPVRPTRRIFLSRRSSTWRRLINEQEIITSLQDLNFETLYIEDYSFEEQVRIFQSAEFIIAPNGSATNNLIFSDPSVKIILLGQRFPFNWGGWFGSFMELGYSPQYLSGGLGNDEEKHSDYTIPVSVVRQKVLKLLTPENEKPQLEI
jgi:tetratricopeptide (TPR) repeat protein